MGINMNSKITEVLAKLTDFGSENRHYKPDYRNFTNKYAIKLVAFVLRTNSFARASTVYGFLLLFCSNLLYAEDWPTYRHDNHRSGRTHEQLAVSELGVAWTYTPALPPQPTWPGPAKWDAYHTIKDLQSMRNYDPVFFTVVAGENLYYSSSADDSLHCLDAKTGRERWLFTTDAPLRVAPSYHKGRLYFGSDDGHAYCIDASDGKLIWKKRLYDDPGVVINNGRLISFWPCRTGVLVEGDTAYCTASLLPWKDSLLCALDPETGKAEGPGRYIKTVKKSTLESPMLATSSRLVVMQGRSAPMLFDKASGNSQGRAGKKGGSIALITADEQLFYGPGPKTGQISASKQMSPPSDKLASYAGARAMVAAAGISYVVQDRIIFAVERSSGKKLWSTKGTYPYGLILAGKTLYAGGKNSVAAFDSVTGKKIRTFIVNGRAHGLTVANGALYVSTDSGDIVCFRAGADTVQSEPDTKPAPEPDITRPAPQVPAFEAAGLAGRWVFQSNTVSELKFRDLAGSNPIPLSEMPAFKTVNRLQAMKFSDGGLTIAANHKTAGLPASNITAEAWVRVDKLLKWGGIVGALQDNGSYERGWILGYNNQAFTFAMTGAKNNRMTYLQAKDKLESGQWYHVVGTYDGVTMRIYVDGRESASSTAQKGHINYPPQAFYEIGAYHDKDENYPLTGMIQEVRIYDRALSADEVQAGWKSKVKLLPAKSAAKTAGSDAMFYMTPYLQFSDSRTAHVFWQTESSLKCTLALTDAEGGVRRFREKSSQKKHEVVLGGLKLGEQYKYSISCELDGKVITSESYDCDTTFNYSVPKAAAHSGAVSDAAAGIVEGVLHQASVDRGIAVVLGCRFPDILKELSHKSRFRVVGLDSDIKRVAEVRRELIRQGEYGPALTVRYAADITKLPFPSHTVDLVINLAGGSDADEIKRILAPGGIGIMNTADMGRHLTKGFFAGAGAWTHMYGLADNATFAGEHLADAQSTADMEVAWMGRPGPRYQVDRQGRGPGPLASNGRLFGQGMDRILALNAFNGTILWSLEIPGLSRYNVPHDCSNWCCDDDDVYVVVHDGCRRFDAATGALRKLYAVPQVEGGKSEYDWGYVARKGKLLLGSNVKHGSTYKGYWGGQYWYDASSGALTANVCSDQLFAQDLVSGKSVWNYRNGVVLNSTISQAGNRLYFVECRNPKVLESESRRVVMSELWQDQFMVALDVETGRKVWERSLTIEPAVTVCYMAHAEGRIVVVSSAKGKYHIYVYSDADGAPQWNHTIAWGRGGRANHGSHLSRPVIVNGTLYVSPKVFELKSGKILPLSLPTANCGSYSACANSLVFRVKPVTRMWNRKSGELSGWSLLRPNCWISTIPANGMLLSLEGGGGCSCGGWIETSFGFIPRSVCGD